MKKLNTLEDVRDEISAVYWCAKTHAMPISVAKDLTTILKSLAGVIRDKTEMDIDVQLDELRASIAALKGEPVE